MHRCTSLTRRLVQFVSFFAILAATAVSIQAAERYDVVFKGGRVVDGTGSPWYVADVGIRDGRIAKIGRIDKSDGEKVIDASGLVVAPGFVDMMGQTATPLLEDPKAALNLLRQGITTINAGEGSSAAPLSAEEGRTRGWTTMAEYFQLLDSQGLPINVVQTVGHTQVRRIVLGEVDRRPTEDELKRMQELVREGMEAGAIGVSTALIYPPAVYATTEEIAALCRVAGEYGGRYYTHMRNEGDRLLEAIDEALDIGRQAGTPVHIFHLKAAGKRNWGKMDQAIAKIRAARAAGEQVAADIYPYVNNGLGIAAFVHPRHFREGYARLRQSVRDPEVQKQIRREMENEPGWENWYRHVDGDWNRIVVGSTNVAEYSDLAGRSLAEIAEAREEDPWETFFNLVAGGAFVLPQSMTDANKIKLMQQDFISFCTDVGPAGGSRIASHPRAYGAFPRLLGRYVRELGATSLERAIAQASATACNEVLAYDRGRIAVGLAADVIAFDPETIIDKATFAEPDKLAEGVEHVVVNGQLVLSEGELTGNRPGRVLRGPGYKPSERPSAVTTGRMADGMEPFESMMRRFMDEHRVPGAALAVTANGKLLLAKGYGYADIAADAPVKPTSRFRIASISKPITAVAILKLVEQKKLKLDDRVFDILDEYEPHFEDGAKFDERQKRITIRHLLQHRGGWDRSESFDAMFQPVRFAKMLGAAPPAGPDEIICCMLGLPLDFDPGRRYAYSNYGYCLLGRVIEEVTEQPYETYVKEHVLAPLGIRGMAIGRTHLKDRRNPSEVRYYDPLRSPSVFAADLNQPVPRPYGAWHLEAMDSHGAWIASAVDLARFAVAFDDPADCPLLEENTVKEMFARPETESDGEKGKPTYYSLGWMNREVEEGLNHWHTGSLPGTATILICRHDGKNFIALFNTRSSPEASHLGRAIDPLLHRAAAKVDEWPEAELFESFE